MEVVRVEDPSMQLVPFTLLTLSSHGKGGVAESGGGLLGLEDAVDFELRPHKVAPLWFVR